MGSEKFEAAEKQSMVYPVGYSWSTHCNPNSGTFEKQIATSMIYPEDDSTPSALLCCTLNFYILSLFNLCIFAFIYAHSSCMSPTWKVVLLIFFFIFWVNFLFKQRFDVYLLEPPTPMWVTKLKTDRVLLITHLSYLSFCRWGLAVEEGQRETAHCAYGQDVGAKGQDSFEDAPSTPSLSQLLPN